MEHDSEKIESILITALEIPSRSARQEYLEKCCGGDLELLHRVEELVENHFLAGDFLKSPAKDWQYKVGERPGVRLGEWIGPYQLLEQIGEGGFGVVFLAEQQQPIRRRVALKVIKPGMDTSQLLARFENERLALALMEHPNIARVLDVGETDSGRPYFVMELVKGVPITEYCDQHLLTTRERLELFVSVCQAVQHAHQKGIIHRDIKPNNVLVAQLDGRPVSKVIDFGVAKAINVHMLDVSLETNFGSIVGTPPYMSPEQANARNVDLDTRTDVYSLGVLLYELMTGSPPFDKKNFADAGILEMLRIIREVDPPTPCSKLSSADGLEKIAANRNIEPRQLSALLRRDLEWIVMKCLEKDRARRYATANGLARDIERYLNEEPVEAGPPGAGYRLRLFLRRNRGPVIASTLLLISLVAGIVGTAFGLYRAHQQQIRAEQAESAALVDRDNAVDLANEARSNLALSQSNLELAVRAVDEFSSKVSESLRLKQEDLRPLRKELLTQSAEFYQDLIQRRGESASARVDSARSCHKLAQLLGEIDRPDRAIELYRKAIDEFDKVFPDMPDDLDLQYELSVCLRELAHLLIDQGESKQCEAILQRGITMHESILETHSDRTPHRRELATLLGLQAYTMTMTQRIKEGELLWRRAIEQLQKLRTEHPENLDDASNLAHAYWKLGDNLRLQSISNWRESEKELSKALDISRLIVEKPEASDGHWVVLGHVLRSVSVVELVSRRTDVAIQHVQEAIEIQSRLTQGQPSVLRYGAETATSKIVLARCYQRLGNRDAARAALISATETLENVITQAPGNVQYESHLADALDYLTDLAREDDDYTSALAYLERSVPLLEGILIREPESLNARLNLPNALMNRAKVRAHFKRFAEALSDADRALRLAIAERHDDMRLARAWILVCSGNYERAVPEAQAALKSVGEKHDLRFFGPLFIRGARVFGQAAELAQADNNQTESHRAQIFEEYSAEAIRLLKTAIEINGSLPPELRELPEYQSIRQRPDFIALFGE